MNTPVNHTTMYHQQASPLHQSLFDNSFIAMQERNVLQPRLADLNALISLNQIDEHAGFGPISTPRIGEPTCNQFHREANTFFGQ